jgi:sulfur-oxidizing protein SoxY
MNPSRRTTLKAGAGLGAWGILAAAGIITPLAAQAAWNKNAFEAKDLASALAALSANGAVDAKDIALTAPDIAENGAVVPLGISASLPGADLCAILIQKNITPLAALFTLPAGTEANVQTRCKMGQTSNVYALVRANGKYYTAKKEVKVTLGGCGG